MYDSEENGVETVSGDSVVAATKGKQGRFPARKTNYICGPMPRTGLITGHLSMHDAIISAISLVPMILPQTHERRNELY